MTFEGIVEKFSRKYIKRDVKTLSERTQKMVATFMTFGACSTGKLAISNATLHNLKNVSVDIPTGILTVVTRVAGSGKSSLFNQIFLRQHPEAIVIDQSAVGASTRSNPATYTGIMDDVRPTGSRLL